MRDGEREGTLLRWMRRIAPSLGLTLILSAGSGLGWHLAGWQDSVLPDASLLSVADNTSMLLSAPLQTPAGPTVATAERMPEAQAEVQLDNALALTDDTWTEAASVLPAPVLPAVDEPTLL